MDDAKQGRQASELKEEIIRLGPWHHNVQVTPEISTSVFLEAPEGTYPSSRPSFINPRNNFVDTMRKIYPEGLEGRTFLDCACNCGGYSFWAKELGASECFGFDAREHWIDQAHFLAENRQWPADRVRFEMLDLYDLPKLGLEPFDITYFKGIFYHLPDPITALKVAADLTREVLILNTATWNDLPDGMLAIAEEGTEDLMTGVHGLSWFPTGPDVLTRILRWMGFTEIRLVASITQHKDLPRRLGRLEIIASRKEGLLGEFESLEKLAISERQRHNPQQHNVNLQKQNNQLQRQSDNLQQQLDAVTSSRTWRLLTAQRKLRLWSRQTLDSVRRRS